MDQIPLVSMVTASGTAKERQQWSGVHVHLIRMTVIATIGAVFFANDAFGGLGVHSTARLENSIQFWSFRCPNRPRNGKVMVISMKMHAKKLIIISLVVPNDNRYHP